MYVNTMHLYTHTHRGMQPHMRFDVFSYNKLFKIYQMEAFVQVVY